MTPSPGFFIERKFVYNSQLNRANNSGMRGKWGEMSNVIHRQFLSNEREKSSAVAVLVFRMHCKFILIVVFVAMPRIRRLAYALAPT